MAIIAIVYLLLWIRKVEVLHLYIKILNSDYCYKILNSMM